MLLDRQPADHLRRHTKDHHRGNGHATDWWNSGRRAAFLDENGAAVLQGDRRPLTSATHTSESAEIVAG